MHENIFRDNLDEADQRKMANGLVDLMTRQGNSATMILALQEENKLLKAEMENAKLIHDQTVRVVKRSWEKECDLIDEKCGRLMEQLKLAKLLNERYLKAINEAMHIMRCMDNSSSAYDILRAASFATFPDKDTE